MTVEFAVGILATIIVLTSLAWMIFVFGVRIAAVDAASAVAKQLARGDVEAARLAEKGGPAGAKYSITGPSGLVRVVAEVDAAPIAGMPSFPVSATAEAQPEPGVRQGSR